MFKEISTQAFKKINQLDIHGLLELPPENVRPLLPSLVRMSLCSSLDTSLQWQNQQKILLHLLSGLTAVNDIISLLTVDFHELKEDAHKEQQMRSKVGNGNSNESILLSGLKQQGILLEFERSDASRKFRIVISELLPLVMKIDSDDSSTSQKSPIESELFESLAYLQDVSDVVCIACAELPSLLQLTSVSEALLCFSNGIKLLSKLIANNSESLLIVCKFLLNKSAYISDKKRTKAILELCRLSPESAFTVRNLCIQNCQLPDLAVSLTLNHFKTVEMNLTDEEKKKKTVTDLVAFVSGLLLGNDSKVRSWFASYIRHTKDEFENPLRNAFTSELFAVVKTTEVKNEVENMSLTENDKSISMNLLFDEHCMRASALIRLFCSLKAIAGIKFSPEESNLLLRLITCYPPMTPAGIRFVSLALGMLLACPSLIQLPEEEKQVISWIRWLASRSSELEDVGPEGCSFAEQLLLTAIHLHGDRYSAAVQLACSTLGMRIKVSTSSLSKLRHIFIEEVFPTQVVAAHAMKISVTKNLNAAMTGYLPVHCIYQLLKTRAFSQGRVPVQDWIYEQICASDTPLHPQLQPLILHYVNTIVTPSSKGSSSVHVEGNLNQPIEESKIMDMFKITNANNKTMDSDLDFKLSYSLTAHLLMLYYVLLYEDAILNNIKTLATLPNQPKRYSPNLINHIPVELLVFKAQKNPKSCQGLYPALLGLLTTHLPHLCLVEDWMQDLDAVFTSNVMAMPLPNSGNNCKSVHINPNQLFEGLRQSVVNPAPALMHLRFLSQPRVSADTIILFSVGLTRGLPFILNEKVSRRVRQEAQKLWLKLNSVIPRKLWVLTVNALQPPLKNSSSLSLDRPLPNNITFQDFLEDPLIPLTVDRRVLRCPELLAIILRILSASLSACRSQASVLLRANPTVDVKSSSTPARSVSPLGNSSVSENEKEELRAALTAVQSSAAVQMLIEICLLDKIDDANSSEKQFSKNLLTYKREVQCLVCSTLHQMFIEDPNVAKVVHFQVDL